MKGLRGQWLFLERRWGRLGFNYAVLAALLVTLKALDPECFCAAKTYRGVLVSPRTLPRLSVGRWQHSGTESKGPLKSKVDV